MPEKSIETISDVQHINMRFLQTWSYPWSSGAMLIPSSVRDVPFLLLI